VAWRLSNTLGAEFCVEALEEALFYFSCAKISFGLHLSRIVFTHLCMAPNGQIDKPLPVGPLRAVIAFVFAAPGRLSR
jgi:hypothetical protein